MVMRLEQGLLSNPLYTEELATLYDSTPKVMKELYYDFIQRTRDSFKEKYPSFVTLNGYRGIQHPLVHYRDNNNLSQVGFCKGLCLHPDPIRDYELNQQRGIPQQLIVACNDIAWNYGHLESAVTEWRIDGRADRLRLQLAKIP